LNKLNQNYSSSKLKNIHSEFTDNKRVDGQILPTNFALIHTAFLLLTHKEHGKLAKCGTNWMSGWTSGPSVVKGSHRSLVSYSFIQVNPSDRGD